MVWGRAILIRAPPSEISSTVTNTRWPPAWAIAAALKAVRRPNSRRLLVFSTTKVLSFFSVATNDDAQVSLRRAGNRSAEVRSDMAFNRHIQMAPRSGKPTLRHLSLIVRIDRLQFALDCSEA